MMRLVVSESVPLVGAEVVDSVSETEFLDGLWVPIFWGRGPNFKAMYTAGFCFVFVG
jgi:hypothetical protein